MDAPRRSFKIKCASGDDDVFLEVAASQTARHLIDEVPPFTHTFTPSASHLCLLRRVKSVPTIKHIRLIVAGREVLPEEHLTDVLGDTLHCIVSDYPTTHGHQSSKRESARCLLDWPEQVDSTFVLLGIVIVLLLAFWILYFLRPEMFEDSSLIILFLLSLVCIVPFCYRIVPSSETDSHHSIDGQTTLDSAETYRQRTTAVHHYDTPPRPAAPLRRR